jgi:hypothetical protein
VRTVFLKHACRRKFTELVTDHVLGNKNGIESLSVVHQKRVPDKIRRHHRAPGPGFLAPALFILSIFSKRYDSTKGPFFNDLAIKIKLLLGPALENEAIAGLVFAARLKTFGELSPWTDRMMPATATF